MIEEIYGIKYELPEKPKLIEIGNSELDKEEQYFRLTKLPDYLRDVEFDDNGNAIYNEQQEEFIVKEIKRINEGYWFFNNGEPTYITGLHYFYLNYWTLEDGSKPDYREVDRRWFYYQDHCETLNHCFGIVRIKKRREGATSQATCYLVWKSITKKKSFCGIVSKTGKDASDAFIYMVMNGYRSLPVYLKPRAEDEDTKTELVFREKKSRKIKVREKGQMFDDDIGIESKINWKNTALNSYDSGRVTALLVDEGGKYPAEVPINQYWPIVKKTLGKGAFRVGFCLMPSTANDSKSGGEPYKKLFDESNHFENEYTATGLYRYFCPAYDGYEGFIDRYGKSIIENPTPEQKKYIKEKLGMNIDCGAKDFLMRQRSLISDPTLLAEEIRMNPFTEEEAFMIDQKRCYFNSEKIYNQIERIEEDRVIPRRIRLYWKSEGVVDWADDKEGMWSVYEVPEKELQNKKLDDRRIPANTHIFCNGIDPYRSTIISGKGSMAAAYVFKRLDPNDPENTGMAVAEFYGRPRQKSMLHEEMLKACVLWGMKANYENDVGDDYVDYFRDRGYSEYLSKTPQAAIDRNKKRTGNVTYGVASRDPFALARQLETCINYIETHCHKIFYRELLEELLNYDHENRTPFDRTVAFMISLLAGVSIEMRKEEIKVRKVPIKSYKLNL